MKKILILSIVVAVFSSCTKTAFTPASVSSGNADFTTFISVGNSLTQGYMNGGLYAYGQSNSYPSILAQQMQMANPSMSFLQPMTIGNGSGYIYLAYVNGQIDPIQPTDSTYTNPAGPDPSWANWGASLQSTNFNNLGIAGIRLTDCVALSPTEEVINQVICGSNPNGRFMNFSGSMPQYIDHIRASKATFFTNWLGSNDVLGYATNGGVLTIDFGDTLDGITAPSIFAAKYDSILLAFNKLGAKGVCITIPNVTSIPYFNTVPPYVVVNGARKYFYIATAKGVRQATDNDYILLTAYDSVQAGEGSSPSRAIENDFVLDVDEAAAVENATLQYNASIKSLAAKYNYGVVDMYAFLASLQNSLNIDGVTFQRTFIQGGTFGLDGIHPNARGYAIVANQIISVINSQYGSTLPMVDITKYKGVFFPNF